MLRVGYAREKEVKLEGVTVWALAGSAVVVGASEWSEWSGSKLAPIFTYLYCRYRRVHMTVWHPEFRRAVYFNDAAREKG